MCSPIQRWSKSGLFCCDSGCRRPQGQWRDGFCPCPSKRRHSAQYQQSEATIHYRYHPLAGSGIQVIGQSVHDGQEFLVCIQPDGTRMLLPAWMTRPGSAGLVVADGPPCFPAAVLGGLFRELEAVLSLLPDSTKTGDSDETTPVRPASTGSVRPPAGASGRRGLAADGPGRGGPAVGKAPGRDRPGGGEGDEGSGGLR